MASNKNIIRTYDAITGALIHSRQLQPPFQESDTGCGDIPNTVGISGTPVIDPSTDIVYFFSKGYHGGATGGGITNGLCMAISLSMLLTVFLIFVQAGSCCML
jgi:iron transport multicopper oxidase